MTRFKFLPHGCLAATLLVAYWAGGPPTARAQQPGAAEEAVRQAVDRFVAAMNSGDHEALAKAWTPDGDVVDVHGHLATARDRLAARVEAGELAPGGRNLRVILQAVRLITPEVAVADGLAIALPADGGTERATRFSAILKRIEGRWLLDALREGAAMPAPAPADLKELEWLLGTWEGKHEDTTFRVVTRYSPDHHYLLREVTVTTGDRVALRGHQRVGWDPRRGGFKSWTFDDDGSVGEGLWSRVGESSWMVEATGIRPDGGQTSAVNTYTPLGPDRLLWQSVGSYADEAQLPDLTVELVRIGDAP